ncbi:DUF938 domain-containing protein [Shewanella colwelliana]|uniref:DUF938 domain-containing protein n=1 Tax=Shewanella colwelliana TaxID=23 RepID=UPI0022AFDA38|nr:DUF938 domain-containing protein [Shewanella colwelliana]MCZ4336888.1 DUF938 domain-containing protein [Shewanella colwelliana]
MSDIQQLPFSQSCENNKQAILPQLQSLFSTTKRVLEVGSGTGQHAVYFAKHLPQLIWLPSDQVQYIEPLSLRIELEGSNNIAQPIALDVTQPWSLDRNGVDAIFSANTLHIMSETMVEAFFDGVKQHLERNGLLCIYGPFNYNNQYTSDSNRQFDIWLKHRNVNSGIREFEWVRELAHSASLNLLSDIEMPANNRLLWFKKTSNL